METNSTGSVRVHPVPSIAGRRPIGSRAAIGRLLTDRTGMTRLRDGQWSRQRESVPSRMGLGERPATARRGEVRRPLSDRPAVKHADRPTDVSDFAFVSTPRPLVRAVRVRDVSFNIIGK